MAISIANLNRLKRLCVNDCNETDKLELSLLNARL